MKVALCCIGRMENRYVLEYVEYYKQLGVDKIFIYDNNYDGEEHFEDVIQQYINEGLVDIIDFRNKSICQLEAYQDCYDKHGNEYDWILFIDCGDEYLFMEKYSNIKEFLKQDKFNGFDLIHVNLMTYGDNDLIYYENKPLIERFKTPVLPLDFKKNYIFPENDHVSSIVRGGIKVEWGATPHTPSNVLNCCDANGKKCNSTSPFVHPFNFESAHFKHFTTKTIQEWMDVKTKRGYPDGNKDYFLKNDAISEFFKVNKLTIDKFKYLNTIIPKAKINILIVNFNTQFFTDTCIKSINHYIKNCRIFVFDNSDKTPFINKYNNVFVIDNTKGDIINFDEWLSNFPFKKPMLNNYGSAKHCYTIEVFMNMFDDNFVLLDSDVIVKKDFSEICDEKYMFVGEKLEKLAFWRPRLAPFLCFINNKMCKMNNVHFFDTNRCTQLTNNGYTYDTGASFLDDASKYEHKFINYNDYIEHYGAGSWNSFSTKKITPSEWANKYLKNNLDIFICTHKNFVPIVHNEEIYKPINANTINGDVAENGLKGGFYSEILTYSYIAKNISLKDYVGFCHYRKYFAFLDNVPNMDILFNKHDVIVAKPLKFNRTVRDQYATCHNIEDMEIIEFIIKHKYQEYYDTLEAFLNSNVIFPYNMFIMKKEDFLEYIEFINGVLDDYVKFVGTDIEERINNNKEKYLKSFSPNNTVDYQYRIGGYLAERLTNVFILKKFRKIGICPVKVTETKYDTEKKVD